jgi:hypothetical protein
MPGPDGTDPPIDHCSALISGELSSACTLSDAPTTRHYDLVQARKVLSWLRLNQGLIINSEKEWCVDRRAIAGAIAWEALRNVKSHHFYSRWSGPGKIHYWGLGTTLLEEVAKLGYLELSSGDSVHEAKGAINAIGACMRAFADVASQLGGYCDFYWWPVLLTNFYNGWTVSEAVRHFTNVKSPTELTLGKKNMSRWVLMNMRYIEDAVGKLSQGCRPRPLQIFGVKRFGDLCKS